MTVRGARRAARGGRPGRRPRSPARAGGYALEESVGFLVHRADLALVSHLLSLFKPHDLTVEQWTVLNRLVEADGITQRELARKAAKNPTTLARILDKMEKKGLVERREHGRDARAFRVTLTRRGRALREELAPLALRALADATAGLTGEDVRTLKRLLDVVFTNLAPRDGAACGGPATARDRPAAAHRRRGESC